MKSKFEKPLKKEPKKKMTEEEREKALVDWFVRVIIARTLKEFYGENDNNSNDKL